MSTPTPTTTSTATPTVTKTNSPTPTTSRSGLGEIYIQAYNDEYPVDGIVDNAYIVIGRDSQGRAIVKTARQIFPTLTPTSTPTYTPTNTTTPTVTPTNTETPTVTPTNTITNTVTPSNTPSPVYRKVNVFNNDLDTSKRIFVVKNKSLIFNFEVANLIDIPNGGRLSQIEIGEIFISSNYTDELSAKIEVFKPDGVGGYTRIGADENFKFTKGSVNSDNSIKIIGDFTSGVDINVERLQSYVLRMTHVDFPYFYGIKTGILGNYIAGVSDQTYGSDLIPLSASNESIKLKVYIGAYV